MSSPLLPLRKDQPPLGSTLLRQFVKILALHPNLPLQHHRGRKNIRREALSLRGDQRSPKAAPRAWRSSFHQPKARNKPMCKVQPPSQAVPTPHKPFWRQASKCPMSVPQRNQHPKTCRTSLSLPASTEAHPSPGPAAQKGTMFQLWSNSQQLTQCSFSKAY